MVSFNLSPTIPEPCWMDIFIKNAHLFRENAPRILADSRMYFSPTPFFNNLAFYGTHLLSNPVLGVYAEWWSLFPELSVVDGCPVCIIAGSPLSGRNDCAVATKDGRLKTVHLSPFMPVWRSFGEINSRVDRGSAPGTVLSLSEIAGML